MKNKIISINIILIFIFTSIISVNAIALTPRIELDEYDITINNKNNVFISGTVSICKGQLVGIYDSNGIILYNYTQLPNSNSSGSFKLQVPSRFLNAGTNTFKVKSLPMNGILNGSNPKTLTIKIQETKINQTITASNLTLNEGESKNLNARVTSGLSLTYKSENNNIATVDNKGNVKGIKKGTTKVVISQSGNNTYKSTTKTVSIVVNSKTDSIKNYTITYNSNGGNGSIAKQTIKSGQSIKLKSNTFTKKYYKFIGWSTTTNKKVVYKNGETITPTKNMILYAVWEAKRVKLTKVGQAMANRDGKAGDSSGKEVNITKWSGYSSSKNSWRNWTYVFRPKDPEKALKAAYMCELGCKNNNIGYSKSSKKYGFPEIAKKKGYDLSKIKKKCGFSCGDLVCLSNSYAKLSYVYQGSGRELAAAYKKDSDFQCIKYKKGMKLYRGDTIITAHSNGKHNHVIMGL